MTDTKTCRECGRELPLASFKPTRHGTPMGVCRECVAHKYHATRANKIATREGGEQPPFSDPYFDGKTIREVMDMMSRAKRWLEARGCVITLSGEYREIIVKKLKFQ